MYVDMGDPRQLEQMRVPPSREAVSSRTNHGNSPLSYLIVTTPVLSTGRQGILMNVLSTTAAPDGLRGRSGSTLLHAAAREGSVRILKTLLVVGCEAEIDAQESQFPHRTPLHCAVWCGHRNMTRVLIAAGADARKLDANGQTVLHLASIRGHANIVTDLLEMELDIEAQDGEGYTPLACAVSRGEVDVLKVLLDAGASTKACTTSKQRILEIAIKEDRIECLRMLLAAGADPEEVNQVGLTALLTATRLSNLAAMDALISGGADVESRGGTVWTPLHFACRQGNVDVIEALIIRGGSLEARTSLKGSTPLHIAAGHLNQCAVKELLLRWGADETALDARGQTPSNVVGQLKHDQRYDDGVQVIRFMLANAPADRSWMRRRIVLMLVCRERTRLSQERMYRFPKKRGGQVAEGGMSTGKLIGAGSKDLGGGHAVDGTELSVGMTAFRDAVTRLAGMDDQSVFWSVMNFL